MRRLRFAISQARVDDGSVAFEHDGVAVEEFIPVSLLVI
jgi:hypothetical protein